MKAYTYIDRGRFEMRDKPRPEIKDPRDAVVAGQAAARDQGPA